MFTALLSILIVLGQNFCWTEEDGGQAWRDLSKMSKSYKAGYCVGLLNGIANVMNHSTLNFCSILEKEGNTHEICPKWTYEDYEALELFNISGEQLMQMIDNFYSDVSNLNVKVIDAVYIVKAQIHGKPPKLIDAQIRYLRMLSVSKENHLIEVPDPTFKSYKNLDNADKLKKHPYTYILFYHPMIVESEVFKNIIEALKWDGKDPKTLIKKVVQEGWVTQEDFLKAGYYCGEDGSLQELFRYGNYELK